MSSILIIALFGVFALGFIASKANLGSEKSFSGRAYVIDGDTLAFGDTRVRLFGIDAPEMGQTQGPAAKYFLLNAMRSQTLTVHPLDTDHYGRIIAKVTLPNGDDLGELMVSQGYALAYTRFGRDYATTQRQARRANMGLWASGGIQDPASYRHAN